MKKYPAVSSLGFVAVLVLAMICAGYAQKTDEGKIPITTLSDEAKKEFVQGRDLSEKLLGQTSIQHFKNAIAEDPNLALAYFYLAQNSPTAKEYFENMKKATALAAKASEGERLYILGFEAGASGNPTKQKECYDTLVAKYPNDQRAHSALGDYYYGQQEYAQAVAHYKKATAIDSTFSPAYNSLGYAYRPMGNYAEAEKAFKKYIELIPKDPNPYDSYAELLMKMGKFDESITSYQKALSLDPNFVGSHLGIAYNLMFKGKPDDAAAQLKKLYSIARDDGERRAALFAQTVLYVDAGKMDTALQEMDKQYAMAEKINDVARMSADLDLKGNILVEMGKYDDALALFGKSTNMVEQSDLSQAVKDLVKVNHHYNVATVALKKNDLTTANAEAKEFRKGADTMRNSALIRQAHQLVGMIALQEKKHDEAIAELRQSSQQNPYNLYRLALAYMGKGDKATAREFCGKAAHIYDLPTLDDAFVRSKAEKMMAMK